MSLKDIATQIDWDGAIAIVTLVVGLLWKKKKGDDTTALHDRLDAAITAEVHAILAGGTVVDMEIVRGRLQRCAWDLVAKIGLGKNAIVNRLVEIAIDEGLAELAQVVEQRHQAQITAQAFRDLAASAAKTTTMFDPPKNPTVPVIDLPMEIVKP